MLLYQCRLVFHGDKLMLLYQCRLVLHGDKLLLSYQCSLAHDEERIIYHIIAALRMIKIIIVHLVLRSKRQNKQEQEGRTFQTFSKSILIAVASLVSEK